QEMLRSFSGLARSWKERYDIDAGLGIGINEGDVVAGNVGSSSYMSYTIIGDTVNIAARLCQRARAGEILFSGSLKQSLDAHGMDVGATPLPPPAALASALRQRRGAGAGRGDACRPAAVRGDRGFGARARAAHRRAALLRGRRAGAAATAGLGGAALRAVLAAPGHHLRAPED